MAYFRKKPVVIQAELASRLITDARNSWKSLPKWFSDAYEKGGLLLLNRSIEIRTLEGTMTANWDDMIVCGVKGEIYPCRRDIFDETNEPVDAPCPATA